MSNTALVNNLYYTCENYNNTQNNIPASQDTVLAYPIIKNGESQNYQLAVSKLRVPLSTIPLTKNNIPLKFYELMLRNGTLQATAYVRQLNAVSGNYFFTLVGTVITRYLYTSTTFVADLIVDYSSITSNITQFLVDDFEKQMRNAIRLASASNLDTNVESRA